ncbi:MAG: ferritin-like domain-containing protein [Podila humilis]|nr:MAG: ferritin-like domain-containing protein [Podila humilis]
MSSGSRAKRGILGDRQARHTSDINILNFALSLEHLEAEFYKQGLAKFGRGDNTGHGYDDKIWERIDHISKHEATHVTFLTSVIESLQGTPLPPCEYKFPLDSLDSFLSIAQALEYTGTSAYLGAASGLEGDLLTAAATITTVITIASNFVESCPFDIPVPPFTQLTAMLPKNGDVKVETSFEGEKAVGYVYVLITDSSAPLSLKVDSIIVAGPALLFNSCHYEYLMAHQLDLLGFDI